MEVLDGTTIFWLLALGMVVGAVTKLAMYNTTIGLVANVLSGIMGSIVVGSIMIAMNLPFGLVFAFLGSLGVVFIVNVFHVEGQKAH